MNAKRIAALREIVRIFNVTSNDHVFGCIVAALERTHGMDAGRYLIDNESGTYINNFPNVVSVTSLHHGTMLSIDV